MSCITDSEFDLDIPNFEKWHKPMKDRKGVALNDQRRDWANLHVDWFLDPKMHDATPTQQLLWVKLLCVRAASGKRQVSVSIAWLQRRVGVKAASVKRDMLKLAELGLIELTPAPLDKKDKKELSSRGSPISIISELEGLDDECLNQITLAAQKGWVREFGAEIIRKVLPTAYSTWKIEKPLNQWGQPKHLALYLRNCFEVEKGIVGRKTENYDSNPDAHQKHIMATIAEAQ